ncbi:hypothetical protein T484DRAFT_1916671 [Baffinella frigidus]|nr:hypothetical protein T484DRAFT_1916671 [Cryptophyta sp. CCMP2293]
MRDDLKLPDDEALAKKIQTGFDDGDEVLITILGAVGTEQAIEMKKAQAAAPSGSLKWPNAGFRDGLLETTRVLVTILGAVGTEQAIEMKKANTNALASPNAVLVTILGATGTEQAIEMKKANPNQ